MQVVWVEAVANFKVIAEDFRSLIENATKYSQVAQATTIGFNFDMSIGIFQPGFYHGINKTTLSAKQRSARDFLQSVSLDFFSAENMLYGRLAFYNTIVHEVNESRGIEPTFELLQNVLHYSSYVEAQQFGGVIRKRDVVCFVSLMYHMIRPRYDYYNLTMMLPQCNVTDAEWGAIEGDAYAARLVAMTDYWVKVRVRRSSNFPLTAHVHDAITLHRLSTIFIDHSYLKTKLEYTCTFIALNH